MQFFRETEEGLEFRRRGETLLITPWGEGLRVRATKNSRIAAEDWALLPCRKKGKVEITEKGAVIENGKIRCTVTPYGKLEFQDKKGGVLLSEYYRSWDYGDENWECLDDITMECQAGRQYKPGAGGTHQIKLHFKARDEEKIFGMGQYQHPYLDLKGCHLELEQKNTQASVPFAVSSLGYGFLLNTPAIGRVDFAKNLTEWELYAAKQIDYWICAGDTPAEIEESYAKVTGTVPMMPDFAMGFWQCKLRYQTQEELLAVAREYHKRKIPVDVIVVDYFHWPNQGDWCFDRDYWPDPEGMIKELADMGMKLMVSVWPTVDRASVHYQEMKERGLLVETNRGISVTMECRGFESFMDATNPETREYVYDIIKENYLDKGVALLWLDEAEPEFSVPDWELYRYHEGPALECGNIYPLRYAQGFYEGMKKDGTENPINLIRCAWAGSQRYGALAWSGDVPSTFTYLRYQMTAGLNMGLAGIPWWTADIGGFHGGNVADPAFHELLARWFQFGAFCPVMRLHGNRDPHTPPLGKSGGGLCTSGAGNEIWSYTPELERMMEKYIRLRDRLRPYVREAMAEAHKKGTPVIKPLFYDFPEDEAAWEVTDEYLFGHEVLCAPVLEAGLRQRPVYLPAGSDWVDAAEGTVHPGGTRVEAAAPIDRMPLFVRKGSPVLELIRTFALSS